MATELCEDEGCPHHGTPHVCEVWFEPGEGGTSYTLTEIAERESAELRAKLATAELAQEANHNLAVANGNRAREEYARAEAAERQLAELAAQSGVPTHRHKKRGTEYVLIGVGKMQATNWIIDRSDEPFGAKVDMREVAIYRSVNDGSLWVRPIEEFEDGRFETLSASPAAPQAPQDAEKGERG